MPRLPRIKAPEYIYHVMCRSISEVILFRDEDDKNYYLDILKRNKEKFCCKIYAYCILDNHLHLHIDPQGFDISKFMHCVNISYVIYYNRKYKRHGHVFQGRFESRILSSDSYNLAVSAYIHNNPKDIDGFRGREHDYPFSSMGFYLGNRKDFRDLVDTGFVMSLINEKDSCIAVKRYIEFVKRHLNTGNVKSIMNCISHNKNNITRDERKILIREAKPGKAAEIIATYFKLPTSDFFQIKYRRTREKVRAFLVFVQRSLCGMSYRQICENIGNMSASGLSRLCSEGFKLFTTEKDYQLLFREIIINCRA